jgi:hypothetical protein
MLWLLTAARLAEVCEARSEELSGGVWPSRLRGRRIRVEHRIALGPWGWALMQADSDWVFPAPKLDGPRSRNCCYLARNRVREGMAQAAGRPIERFAGRFQANLPIQHEAAQDRFRNGRGDAQPRQEGA